MKNEESSVGRPESEGQLTNGQRKTMFTYGDRIRRKAGGPVETVSEVGHTAYYFESGRFALQEDEDCYMLVEKHSGYFLVDKDLGRAPLNRHSEHGYEERSDFREALRRLVGLWGGRTGERIGDRNGFLHLRFHDTPGGRPDEAWLPLYLLRPCPMPEYMNPTSPPHPFIEELDSAFGFD